MLIIGREVGQSVIIGKGIKVTVLQYGSRLQLAIDAPPNRPVTRIKSLSGINGKMNNRTRTIGDMFQIGETIKVTLLLTENGLYRIAIDAPKEVRITREELLDSQFLSFNRRVLAL